MDARLSLEAQTIVQGRELVRLTEETRVQQNTLGFQEELMKLSPPVLPAAPEEVDPYYIETHLVQTPQ